MTMKLLMLSSIRYIKRHWIQAILTFLMTMLITVMLSVVFNFAASFMDTLRRSAIENAGAYHYMYKSDDIVGLYKMALDFDSDPWFSEVSISTVNDEAVLMLTVSKPGLFTTKKMDKKFSEYRYKYQINKISMEHNWELLASYGDLCRENGIYAFLLIFLFILSIIIITSLLTLSAVLKINSNQRERDFALFSSAGASNGQICSMLLLESLLYTIIAIPFGIILGIYLLSVSNTYLDRVLSGLGNFLPVRMVISVPYIIVLIIFALLIILGSAYMPARSVSKIRPIEVLRNNRNIYMPKLEMKNETKGFSTTSFIYKVYGVEGLLAKKSHDRFKRRYHPVLLAMSVSIALCLALSSLGRYTNDVIGLTYHWMDYNIDVTLSSNDREGLDSLAQEIMQVSGFQLASVRNVRFELRRPYPLSDLGINSGLFNGSGRMPDVILISVDFKTFRSICDKIGCDVSEFKENSGIFLNTERIWTFDGIMSRGKLFHLEQGDMLSIYSMHESFDRQDEQEAPIEIMIKHEVDYWPPFSAINAATSLTVLVSEETFLSLEPKRPFIQQDEAIHRVSLRGMIKDTEKLEILAGNLINQKADVNGIITNYAKIIEKEQAVVAGIKFLLCGLIIILILICLFSNFIVTWTISNTRKKEFAILYSIGMTSCSINKMKRLESVQNDIKALIPGVILGMIFSFIIHRIYLTEYIIQWAFPWNGLLIGIMILWIVTLLTEMITAKVVKNVSIVEILRED